MPDECEVLEIPEGTALLRQKWMAVDTTGRVVEVDEDLFVGGRYELHYEIPAQ